MVYKNINALKIKVVEKLYNFYFSTMIFALSEKGKYVFVDIDNTVNCQSVRLLRFTKDGQCDFKTANQFNQLIKDIPLPGSVTFVEKLARRYQIIWFTSRSIKHLPATIYWLAKNGFPIHMIIFTGSMMRKISFLEFFTKKHTINFIVDDMKEGHESGKPHYVTPFKNYLVKKNLTFYEDLSALQEHEMLEVSVEKKS